MWFSLCTEGSWWAGLDLQFKYLSFLPCDTALPWFYE